jgi:hypothetical protein
MKKIRNWVIAAFASSVFALAASAAPATTTTIPPTSTTSSGENWKSYHPANNFTLGASGGLGLVNTTAGFTFIGNAAAKIVKDGFVPDIVNPVFLEVMIGPLFVSGATFWMYSTHLRWDFVKDQYWTLFALGGFGGNIVDDPQYGDRTSFHPRFGVGAFYALDLLDIRMDFSHELITVGASFPF